MAVNVPQTIWQPTDGNSEFSNTGFYFIDDPSSVFLVDPSGVFIIDTGITQATTPATVWSQDDSL